MEISKSDNIQCQQELDNTRYQLEVVKSDVTRHQIKVDAEKDYLEQLKNKSEKLLKQKKQLETEVLNLSSEINRLNNENSQLIEDNASNKNQILELQEQINTLSSQVSDLEEQKNKILNPTQVDEFTITKKLFSGATIKSNNNNGSVGIYLQQLVNMAKDYENMKNRLAIALDKKEKAISEKDIAFKELEQIKENAWKSELNAVTRIKIQTNNERNQFNLLREVCNIPKDIDTYDKLNHYLKGNGKNRGKIL